VLKSKVQLFAFMQRYSALCIEFAKLLGDDYLFLLHFENDIAHLVVWDIPQLICVSGSIHLDHLIIRSKCNLVVCTQSIVKHSECSS
jgi:hypothetical protein